MEVKKVGTEAIPAIQSLAEITWAVAYRDILSPEQMHYMLDLIYSQEALTAQMEEGHQFVLLVMDDLPIGFASYSKKSPSSPAVFKLHKIYVDPTLQGKGAGKFLLNYVLEDIGPLGAKSLQLNVNRQNKALGFYQRQGFIIIAEADIPIGNGYFMNDYIMELSC